MEEKEILIQIGNNIRAERNRKNLSQDAVAKELGIARETYNNYENGDSKINVMQLIRLSQLFECKVTAFYMNL